MRSKAEDKALTIPDNATPVRGAEMVTPVGILSKMVPIDGDTKEAIMISMMETDEHLSLKTDLVNPMATTQLQEFAEWLRLNGLDDAADAIDKFVIWYKENQVSDHRKGRKELFRTLAAMQEEEKLSKWTGQPKEGEEQ